MCVGPKLKRLMFIAAKSAIRLQQVESRGSSRCKFRSPMTEKFLELMRKGVIRLGKMVAQDVAGPGGR